MRFIFCNVNFYFKYVSSIFIWWYLLNIWWFLNLNLIHIFISSNILMKKYVWTPYWLIKSSNVLITFFYYIKILNKFVCNLPKLNRWCDNIPHHLVLFWFHARYIIIAYHVISLLFLWFCGGGLCLGISCFDLSKFLSPWHLSLVVFYKTCKFWHLFSPSMMYHLEAFPIASTQPHSYKKSMKFIRMQQDPRPIF